MESEISAILIDDAFIAKGDTILNPKRYDPKAREFVDDGPAFHDPDSEPTTRVRPA